ncbi:hypothetical protein K432DRAFT_296921 [Lepidopterella palustris CBS 459.81]|uniref:PH domain-containing protein n=1 Tax=Lepidopterella palustris CBS 459.81 TaxID=1314670 RepID=A0A8E2EB82_9PEZI|nr:hypothetical protein K432DRAFT_296921 [Lepidopterella palustris CBS 459.81]
MATSANPPPGALPVEDHNGSDPFVSSSVQNPQRHRYSAFDNQQFSLYTSGSPSQTRSALQAHLAETTRRLQETSQLGNALVQQRQALEESLLEVEKKQEDNEIGPELRQKLVELEKEFNEVGRETARAIISKSRVPSGEAPDAAAGASVYSSEAQPSPSKVSVPSRKLRNQQPSRVPDIKLATEISTSLLSQLRELQALLSEKDDALKNVHLERSQLEIEVEGLSQRLRALDDSENRLKDVNWNLETQVRELEAASKNSADREQRLGQSLNVARSEKSFVEREFEELKQIYAKLHEDHSASIKHHESELSSLRRHVSMGETERGALQRKVDELATQNQELAKAVAYRMRAEDLAGAGDTSSDNGGEDGDAMTPEHSPPPSPSKATPRHGQLESETLKHSLHHAHRMIQNLKNNIHREKTEKIELKRMLQDARDELESKRDGGINGIGSADKRRKQKDKDVFKKPLRPDRLGAVRSGNQEIVVDDEDWEEQEGQDTPSRRSRLSATAPGIASARSSSPGARSAVDTSNEAFETATENSDAFETANEQDGTATETDAFQTGAETLDGDSSDDLTETEGGLSTGPVRNNRPSPLMISGNRNSYQSTASTSGDDADDMDVRTPVQAQHPRYRLRIRQGGYRRSPRSSGDVFSNTPSAAKDSPASFASHSSTPAQGQSLFAELGSLSGESEDGSVADGTPSRSILLSPESSPEILRRSSASKSPLQTLSLPKPAMIDSGMMTEPWEPKGILANTSDVIGAALAGGIGFGNGKNMSSHEEKAPEQVSEPTMAGAAQPLVEEPHAEEELTDGSSPLTRKVEVSHVATATETEVSPRSIPLAISPISVQHTEPTPPTPEPFPFLPLHLSSITALHTEPVEPPRPTLSQVSAITAQHTEPIEPPKPGPNQISIITAQHTEPIEPTTGLHTEPIEPARGFVVAAQHAEPIEPPKPAPNQLSIITAQHTEPIEPARGFATAAQRAEPIELPKPAPHQLSIITAQHTEPVEPAKPPMLPVSSHRFSSLVVQETLPESPTVPGFLPMAKPIPIEPTPRVPVINEVPLSFSDILFQVMEPQEPPRPPTAHRVVNIAVTSVQTGEDLEEKAAVIPEPETTKSELGFFSTVLPWSKVTSEPVTEIAEDETRQPLQTQNETADKGTEIMDSMPTATRDGRMTLAPIAANVAQAERSAENDNSRIIKPVRIGMSDEGTQTMVSAEQIDKLLSAKAQRIFGAVPVPVGEKRVSSPPSPSSPKKTLHIATAVDPYKTPRRPGSAGSMRSRAASPPPLPADHKEVIAAAAQKTPLVPSVSTAPATSPGSMGPPSMPASAYKGRPRTPTRNSSNSGAMASPVSKGSATPRPRFNTGRSDVSSPGTRRSSVSSFASEIDQRFNISTRGAMPQGQEGFDPGTTDPRMIQAITQTMIGEFLWKYTRKAGREGMSENRHRRFFWVHPYTRTLYWSEQDPAMAGRAQLKAKSVAIEAVQVVTDDNPFPPGLHRKSLIVVTPGRSVKFTATTGQRHETWFNALSYLLLRSGQERDDDTTTAAEDIAEFNPSWGRSTSRQTARSRVSQSSYTSHRTSSPQRAQYPSLAQRQSTASHRASSQGPPQPSTSGRLSSLSGMFRPGSTLRGSFSSRRSRASTQEASVYTPSATHDSAEDLRLAILQQEQDGLENVRACCDGKHDVGSLSRQGRYGSHTSRHSFGNTPTPHSRTNPHGPGAQNQSLSPQQHELEATNSGAGH